MPVKRSELHRRVDRRSRRAADEKGSLQPQRLHVLAEQLHLVKRRGDQSAYTDNVRPNLGCFLENGLLRDHDSEIRDLETVAGEHYTSDIFPYVMDIALDGGQ